MRIRAAVSPRASRFCHTYSATEPDAWSTDAGLQAFSACSRCLAFCLLNFASVSVLVLWYWYYSSRGCCGWDKFERFYSKHANRDAKHCYTAGLNPGHFTVLERCTRGRPSKSGSVRFSHILAHTHSFASSALCRRISSSCRTFRRARHLRFWERRATSTLSRSATGPRALARTTNTGATITASTSCLFSCVCSA